MANGYVKLPVVLWLESENFQVAIHTKSKGWCLAWAIRHHLSVEFGKPSLKIPRLEPCERHTNLEI